MSSTEFHSLIFYTSLATRYLYPPPPPPPPPYKVNIWFKATLASSYLPSVQSHSHGVVYCCLPSVRSHSHGVVYCCLPSVQSHSHGVVYYCLPSVRSHSHGVVYYGLPSVRSHSHGVIAVCLVSHSQWLSASYPVSSSRVIEAVFPVSDPPLSTPYSSAATTLEMRGSRPLPSLCSPTVSSPRWCGWPWGATRSQIRGRSILRLPSGLSKATAGWQQKAEKQV